MPLDFTAFDQAVTGVKSQAAAMERNYLTQIADLQAQLNAQPAPAPEPTPEPTPTPNPSPVPTVNPVNVPSLSIIPIGSNSFQAQTPNKPHSLAVDNVGVPTYSRHELRPDETYSDGTTTRERCELRNRGFLSKTLDNWVSGSFRYNGSFGSGYCLISQYHQAPGSPVIGWTILGGKLEIYTRGGPTHPSTSSSITRFSKDLNAMEDEWIHMVMRVRLGAAGQMDFWVNGTKLGATKTGIPISWYNDAQAPYEKHGIYREHHPATLVVEWANWECGTTSLLSRVSNPLPVPA